jgi:hypothetical protein
MRRIKSGIELHGFKELLNPDRGLSGVHEIPRFDKEALWEAAHGVFHPRQVDEADERIMATAYCRPMRWR